MVSSDLGPGFELKFFGMQKKRASPATIAMGVMILLDLTANLEVSLAAGRSRARGWKWRMG